MQIQASYPNFQSKIKFIDFETFVKKTKKLNPRKHEVGYPWSPNEIKKGKKIFTKDILDCIAGGVIDNNEITMFHICTLNQKNAKKHRLKAFNIAEFERRLTDKIDLAKEHLHGIILGGMQMRENSKYNVNKLNKIKAVFEKFNIPYTIFGARRDVHYFGRFGLLFDGREDTIYISNNIAKTPKPDGMWKEIIVDGDKLVFHTYEKSGFGYDRTRNIGTLSDFLKSQFRQISVCQYDEFA